jgi:hypothetical protein
VPHEDQSALHKQNQPDATLTELATPAAAAPSNDGRAAPSASESGEQNDQHDQNEAKIWEEPQIGRRRSLPTNRACAVAGIVAGLLDGVVLLSSGQPAGRSIIGALFLGVFVYGGMRILTAIRRKIRPDETTNTLPSTNRRGADHAQNLQGAPKGGWANPTTAQKFANRIRRILSNYGKRRPPRR